MYAAVVALAVCQWGGGWNDGWDGPTRFQFQNRDVRFNFEQRPRFRDQFSEFDVDGPTFRLRPRFVIEPQIDWRRPRSFAGGGGCYQRPVPFGYSNGYSGNGFAPRQRSWGLGVGVGVGGFRRDGFARGGG